MTNNEATAIRRIRDQYTEEQPSRLEELRALTRRASRPAKIFAYLFGAFGCLVLGLGMCLAMKVIGDAMILGIVIGCIGILLVSLTYPLYKRLLARRRTLYADQILTLSDELLNKQVQN